MKPLFIFSLPRSGSTFIQRVLASDQRISSLAEPWLLLPFIYALKKEGSNAEYVHQLAHFALSEFIAELPNGKQDYFAAVRQTALDLYCKAAKHKDAEYFLDKTPRYALITDEIIETFPDGKFIFLWRNPLAIIASMIETWGSGQWNIFNYDIDLFQGMARLIDSYQSNSENVLAIQYEHFLQFPENELARVSNYLDMELDQSLLEDFSKVRFKGKMVDPTGTINYQVLTSEPLNKWKETINNPLRKRYCRWYLNWLGEERLRVMGYDLNELLNELGTVRTSYRYLFQDIRNSIRYKIRSIANKLGSFGQIT